jgi:hypothetical protein
LAAAFGIVKIYVQHHLFEPDCAKLKQWLLDKKKIGTSPTSLDQAFNGRRGALRPKILELCAEYIDAGLSERGARDLTLEDLLREILAPLNGAAAIPVQSGIEEDLPAVETEIVSASVEARPAKHGRRDDQDVHSARSGIPWLRRADPLTDYGGSAPPFMSAWPVSWPATVGLDRGRQITIAAAGEVQVLLDELRRVEALLADKDATGRFPRRTWSLHSGWYAESETAGMVVELTSDLERRSKDVIEGVVQRHFERHDGSPAASLVLIFPLDGIATACRVAATLSKGNIETVCDATIDLLVNDHRSWTVDGVRSAEAEIFRVITEFEHLEPASAFRETLSGAASPRSRRLLEWLEGRISDVDYLSTISTRDLRMAVLAGRFGKSGARPTPNAVRRSTALIEAARGNSSLFHAFGSLPVEAGIVDRLVSAPTLVRAVAGLVTFDEARAVPLPWFNQPVDTWRHGRLLRPGGRQRKWVQAAS